MFYYVYTEDCSELMYDTNNTEYSTNASSNPVEAEYAIMNSSTQWSPHPNDTNPLWQVTTVDTDANINDVSFVVANVDSVVVYFTTPDGLTVLSNVCIDL